MERKFEFKPKWDGINFTGAIDAKGTPIFYGDILSKDGIVLGNIYENPELVKDDNKIMEV